MGVPHEMDFTTTTTSGIKPQICGNFVSSFTNAWHDTLCKTSPKSKILFTIVGIEKLKCN